MLFLGISYLIAKFSAQKNLLGVFLHNGLMDLFQFGPFLIDERVCFLSNQDQIFG